MEHFPVCTYRWSLRVIQMCNHTRLDKLMIHILLQAKVVYLEIVYVSSPSSMAQLASCDYVIKKQ